MTDERFSVRVPASTANLGPGFDSIGLAIDLYLTVQVSPADEWRAEYLDDHHQHLSDEPDNLIIDTARTVAAEAGRSLPPAHLQVISEIPLGKGLGSSAAAIAAGIEIADRLLGLNWPMTRKVEIGSRLEGHPDNISASLMGGLTVSYYDEDELATVHVAEPALGILLLVPAAAFLTVESRGLLPSVLPYEKAITGSAAANVVSAALISGDWKTAGRMMEKDLFHEPYRKDRLPDFDEIRQACRTLGAYGSAISGAGPSIFIAVPQGSETEIAAELRVLFPRYDCLVTKPAFHGIESRVSIGKK
ncbi:homoserine kinase [Planococcus lenghuensis]|uniref:Homoserine kinase n=1 Tax=Planococcus lenghuensis TaxID=2213202 RepID=A0A1Q2L265_9BACL|nr:homoserine kinase [Planococcus lenghuensis]AQQ54548.1 homoserine kinase [Planococcus lenghuensis]